MKNNFNPPFSLFREYVRQLMDYGKKFIIIGNQGAASYKEIFPYFKNNEMWYGASMNGANRWFIVPDKYEFWNNAAGAKIENGKKMLFVNGVVWFTNITNVKRNTPIDLIKRYSNEYPHYENYDAIEVSRVEDIPYDYDGIMGVPISFLHKYNPEQFEIVGLGSGYLGQSLGIGKINPAHKKIMKGHSAEGDLYFLDNGIPKVPYSRILIRKRNA